MVSSAVSFTQVIPVGAAIPASNYAVNLSGRVLKRIYTDVNMEGTALRFYQSDDNSVNSYQLSRDSENNVIEIAFTKGDVLELSAALFAGIQFVKVQTTDGAGTPVVQTGADATLKLVGVTL